jgi:hypothetical protein
MLEATIGLNEVEQQPAALPVASNGEIEGNASAAAEGTSFTQQDVKFLRSLRISVEGQEQDSLSDN